MFLLYEYNVCCYQTDNITLVMHEMLSLVLARVRCHLPITDIYIENANNDNNKKRFNYVSSVFKYNVSLMALTENDVIYVINDNICNALLNNIAQSQNSISAPVSAPVCAPVSAPVSAPVCVPVSAPVSVLASNPLDELYDDTDNETVDEDQLNKIMNEINELKAQKELTQSITIKIKEEQDKKADEYMEIVKNINYEKKKQFVDKEREIEKRRRYKAQKKAFYMLKSDIDTGKTTTENISSLFINDYEVFSYMLEMKLLSCADNDDTDEIKDDYFIYYKLMDAYNEKTNNDNNVYIPHNYYYLSDDDKTKYDRATAQTNNYNLVDEFINKHTNNKKQASNSVSNKSLNDILIDLDTDDMPDVKIPNNTYSMQ